MGNWASRLGCLGERRSRFRTGPKAQESPSPCADLQDLCPPVVSWAWWGSHAIQVTEVTETVVTETVVTEAVEVGPGQQERQPAQRPPALLNTLQSWLDGMEELQASQGPLAADATVAAAQLREQELLQCLLQERAPQVEPRLQEVGSPAELRAQWHRLVQRAETRWGLLQQLVPAAQSFDAARETLLARLGLGERLLVVLGQGQLGPKGQERVVQCLQHMCQGTTAYAEDLGRALETGQRLAELLMEDEAQLVRQQLEELQECVKLTVSGAAQVWQTLLCAKRIGLPPIGLKAQLDLERATSEGPGLKDQEQLSIQLAQLAEWLEQLASQAEVPGQAAAHMVSIREQWSYLSSAVLQAELGALRGHWSEIQEPYGLKAIWELAQWSPCDLEEQAAIKKGLKPKGGWAPVQSWRLEVLPGVLRADRLKLWTAAPVQVLAHRNPDQADTPRVSQEELNWLPWAEAAMRSWSHRKLDTREKSWQDKDHLEQDLMDRVLASGEQERDGMGCLGTSWGLAPTSQLTIMLESEPLNSQQPPSHSMARAGDKHTGCQRWVHGPGNAGEQVARGALMVRVGGGWVALDEFLVKNDPGRAKGRTSCKIQERFQCWAGLHSPRARNIISLRLWTSISSASTRPLPQKGGAATARGPKDLKVRGVGLGERGGGAEALRDFRLYVVQQVRICETETPARAEAEAKAAGGSKLLFSVPD
ncbi:uncharacterized protein LOC101580262 [Octodon degus]|uniref:Uncharacterized protein LOC101580262 n=1 Tax=Octodon degus TaxID=10160 RepID=A0A6P6F4V1_OCTDE|nr:uncharacterized protein LOC101580262 [Octodon degus]